VARPPEQLSVPDPDPDPDHLDLDTDSNLWPDHEVGPSRPRHSCFHVGVASHGLYKDFAITRMNVAGPLGSVWLSHSKLAKSLRGFPVVWQPATMKAAMIRGSMRLVIGGKQSVEALREFCMLVLPTILIGQGLRHDIGAGFSDKIGHPVYVYGMFTVVLLALFFVRLSCTSDRMRPSVWELRGALSKPRAFT
jgi:hypothetical protein